MFGAGCSQGAGGAALQQAPAWLQGWCPSTSLVLCPALQALGTFAASMVWFEHFCCGLGQGSAGLVLGEPLLWGLQEMGFSLDPAWRDPHVAAVMLGAASGLSAAGMVPAMAVLELLVLGRAGSAGRAAVWKPGASLQGFSVLLLLLTTARCSQHHQHPASCSCGCCAGPALSWCSAPCPCCCPWGWICQGSCPCPCP